MPAAEELDAILASYILSRGVVDRRTLEGALARIRGGAAVGGVPAPALARTLVYEWGAPPQAVAEAERVVRENTRVCTGCSRLAFLDPRGPGIVRCPGCGRPVTASAPALRQTPTPGTEPGSPDPGNLEFGSDPSLATSPDAALARGSRFGDYLIIEELGRGGMGAVYRARHVELGRDVALKVMRAPARATETQQKRFQREARAAARLSHPNVVQVHAFGEVGGLDYFTMDLVLGQPLSDTVVGDPRPIEEAVRIARDIARGVGHAHEHGVIHRDLKPANVIVDALGVPRVTDFGLARDLEARTVLTRTGAVLGTPQFMSPEQAMGDARTVGPQTDVWSIGVILYQLLTHELPFSDLQTPKLLQLICEAEPAPPSRLRAEIPPSLENIVLKALEKHPRDRYPDANRLADDLDRFLRGSQVSARRAGRTTRTLRRLRSATIPFLVGAVVAAAAATGYLGLGEWMERRRARERTDTASRLQEALRAIETARAEAVRGEKELGDGFPRAAARAAETGLAALARAATLLANLPADEPRPDETQDAVRRGIEADLRVLASDAIRAQDGTPSLPRVEAVLRQALEAAPGHRRASLRLADLCLAAGRAREALPILDAQDPRDPEVALFRARALLAAGRPDDAVAAAGGGSLDGNPLRGALLVVRGEAHLAAGRGGDAMADAEAALAAGAGALAACLRARALARTGRPFEAWADLVRTVNSFPDDPEVYIARAEVEMGLGRFLAAASDARTAVEKAHLGPAETDARLFLSYASFVAGSLDEALDALAPLLGGDDPYARARALVASALLARAAGRDDEALRLLAEASTTAPFLAAPHVERGRTLLARLDAAGARAAFQIASRIDPDDPRAAAGLARSSVLAPAPAPDDLDRARQAADRAVAGSPDDPDALCARAAVREAQGDAAGAAEDRRRAYAVESGSPAAGPVLARAGRDILAVADRLARPGLLRLAEPLLERAAVLSVAGPRARTGLAQIAGREGRPEDEVRIAERAVAENPESPDALFGLARAYMARNRFEEADGMISRAIAAGREDAEALNARGYIRWRLGRYADAVADFTAVLARDPDHLLALRNRAVNRRALGDEAGAAEDEAAAATLDRRGELANAELQTGHRLFQQDRFTEAALHYRNACALLPDEGLFPQNLANAYFQAGRMVDAQVAAARSVALTARYESSFMENIYQMRQFPDRAPFLEAYERVAAEHPDDPGPPLLLGIIPCLEGALGDVPPDRVALALGHLDDVIRRRPLSVAARAYRALGHLVLGFDEEAAFEAAVLAEMDPDAGIVLLLRAILAGRRGDTEEAARLLGESAAHGTNLALRAELQLLPARVRDSEAVRRLVGP